MYSLEFARRLALLDPLTHVVDPPAALPLVGIRCTGAIRLEDYFVWADTCRLVRVEHPTGVCKSLRGVLEEELFIRRFVDRVREDMEAESDEAREEAREVLHPACGSTAIDVGDVKEVPSLGDIHEVVNEASKGFQVCRRPLIGPGFAYDYLVVRQCLH
jgi:hypothetical protein